MTTYVAFLRAVNVGTTNRIRMADLKAAFVEAGFTDAVTHIQTGNIVFTSSAEAAEVKDQVQALIQDRIGLTLTAVIRTAAQLAQVTESNPFAAQADGAADMKKLYVAFLDAKPAKAAIDAFLAAPIGDDEVRVNGREVYIRYAVGAGTTKMSTAVWNKLGVAATARNWNVTTTLAGLAAAHRRWPGAAH